MATISTELNTTQPTLPPATDAAAATPRPHRHWWGAGIAAAILVAIVLAAVTVPVPYIAILPGSTRPVSELITVSGVPSYQPEQSVAFTTVSAREATVFDALRGWLDDEIDVVADDQLRGGRSRDENLRYNAQLMDTSKLFAITVAVEHLGYDVHVTTSGAVVREIEEGSPAEAAGLQLDDVVIAVDAEEVDELGELGRLLQVGGVGAEHTITVERPAGSETLVDLRTGTVAAEGDPERAIIGIRPEERIVDFGFPFEIEIDSGDVGGPSAGLAFALAVLDVLTEGELTGGKKVAVTGTMELDGRVGPVGGGLQKAVTVRNAGYDAFLVPSDEFDLVHAAVGDDLEVIAVDTLAEALDALDSLGGNAASLDTAGGGAA